MLPLHQSSITLHFVLVPQNELLGGDGETSNSHTLRRWNLNPVRLPISPRPQWLCIL